MKKLLLALVLSLCVTHVGECAHQYIWNNEDFVFYIDDNSIITNKDKSLALFDVISIERRTGNDNSVECMFVKNKSDCNWYFDIPSSTNAKMKLKDYDGYWWQQYGFDWLKERGYVEN